MARFIHFEVSATDPARAGKFFGGVFGWRFERWADADYWMITLEMNKGAS
jgi:uncharacterized protein